MPEPIVQPTPPDSPEVNHHQAELKAKISLQVALMYALEYVRAGMSMAEQNEAITRWVTDGYAEIYDTLVKQRPELMTAYEKNPDHVLREVTGMIQNMKAHESNNPETTS